MGPVRISKKERSGHKSLEITSETTSWGHNLDLSLPINSRDIPNFKEWVNWSGWEGYDLNHKAFDFAAYLTRDNTCVLGLPKETPIRAIAEGIVTQVSDGFGGGVPYACYMNIEHGATGSGLGSLYCHISPVYTGAYA